MDQKLIHFYMHVQPRVNVGLNPTHKKLKQNYQNLPPFHMHAYQ